MTFQLPFEIDGSVSSHFGLRQITPTDPWIEHTGIDWRKPVGTPVIAAADGVVSLVLDDVDDAGYAIYIQHGEHGAVLSAYCHLDSDPLFAEMDRVKQGDVIGYVGDSGNSSDSHLHFEVLVRGIPYNPLTISTKWTHYNSVDWDSTANTQEEINGGN